MRINFWGRPTGKTWNWRYTMDLHGLRRIWLDGMAAKGLAFGWPDLARPGQSAKRRATKRRAKNRPPLVLRKGVRALRREFPLFQLGDSPREKPDVFCSLGAGTITPYHALDLLVGA